jgi:hypothetical protein
MNVYTLSLATTKMMVGSEMKKAVVSLNFRTTFRLQSLTILTINNKVQTEGAKRAERIVAVLVDLGMLY